MGKKKKDEIRRKKKGIDIKISEYDKHFSVPGDGCKSWQSCMQDQQFFMKQFLLSLWHWHYLREGQELTQHDINVVTRVARIQFKTTSNCLRKSCWVFKIILLLDWLPTNQGEKAEYILLVWRQSPFKTKLFSLILKFKINFFTWKPLFS